MINPIKALIAANTAPVKTSFIKCAPHKIRSNAKIVLNTSNVIPIGMFTKSKVNAIINAEKVCREGNEHPFLHLP